MGIPHASDREARVASDLCIGHDRLRSFLPGIFAAAGSSPQEARIVSDHLVDANLTGHDSHGLIRAAKYVDWIRDGQLLPNRRGLLHKHHLRLRKRLVVASPLLIRTQPCCQNI